MSPFEILLCVFSVCVTSGAIAYTRHVVRANVFEQPTEAQIQHMIDTAPRESRMTSPSEA